MEQGERARCSFEVKLKDAHDPIGRLYEQVEESQSIAEGFTLEARRAKQTNVGLSNRLSRTVFERDQPIERILRRFGHDFAKGLSAIGFHPRESTLPSRPSDDAPP